MQKKPNEEWHPIETEEYADKDISGDTVNQPDSPFVTVLESPSSLLKISAFPSSLREQPWFKAIEIPLNTDDLAYSIQIMWPLMQIDLNGLGKIKIYPQFLEVSLGEVMGANRFSLALYNQNQQEFGTIAPGLSLERSTSDFSGDTCFLKIAGMARTSSEKKLLSVQVRLHTFQAVLVLSSKNLWWLGEDKRRMLQDNEVKYEDPYVLLEDLGTNLERFIAESGVIGYEERRWKIAITLFALGRVAQAIEAYSQAI